MGLGDKLIGALFKYDGEALHVKAGEQVTIMAKGRERPISAKAITISQVEDVLTDLAPPGDRQIDLDGRHEFTSAVEQGLVRVISKRSGDHLELRIAPDGLAGAEPEAASGVAPPSDDRTATASAPVSSQPAATSTPSPAASAAPAASTASAPSTAGSRPRPARSGDTPAIERYFDIMVSEGASDLHLNSENPPFYRKDGDIVTLGGDTEPLTPGRVKELLLEIMPERNQQEFETDRDTDFAYEIPGVARFRCNVFMDRKGWGGVFRQIPADIMTAEDLKLSKDILDLCYLSKGLVIVTGPTGSGKSTTLAAMVDYINRNRNEHIITIEDPIEFVHPNKKCLINQREVGVHTQSFKRALRAALREDPDIVLVGEMRDLETIAIAMETAETGHLVFGTLHTSTAPSTVDRIIDQFPADQQAQIRTMLSESLKAVIAQTLCKRKGGGRIAALEVLMITAPVSNLIREGKTFQIPSAMQTGKNVGMVMLNEALLELVKDGKVEPREAYIKSIHKKEFKKLLERNNYELDL